MSYEIRELRGKELEALNTPIPFPEVTAAKVAYDEAGNIVGFGLFHLVPHVDGFWISPDHRGGSLTADLAHATSRMAREGTDYYVSVATSPFVDRICEEEGMKPMAGRMYVWRKDRVSISERS